MQNKRTAKECTHEYTWKSWAATVDAHKSFEIIRKSLWADGKDIMEASSFSVLPAQSAFPRFEARKVIQRFLPVHLPARRSFSILAEWYAKAMLWPFSASASSASVVMFFCCQSARAFS